MEVVVGFNGPFSEMESRGVSKSERGETNLSDRGVSQSFLRDVLCVEVGRQVVYM